MALLPNVTVGTVHGTFLGRDCPDCDGVGLDAGMTDCRRCDGSGITYDPTMPIDDAAREHFTFLRSRNLIPTSALA